MGNNISEKYLLSPYMAFFAAHCMQLGVGFLTFQSALTKIAGQDAWIVVILNGLIFHFVIWMMYRILNSEKKDIISINQVFFGRWIGNLLNLVLIGYLLLFGGTVLGTFIEIVQVWMFPDLERWILNLVLLSLACYAVYGGLRIVIGVCFFSLFQYLLLFIYVFLAPYFHFSNFLPIMDHKVVEIAKGLGETTFIFLGVEVILICYPFFKQPQKSERWVHLANLTVTLFYLSEILTSLAFFSKDQLIKLIWPTLSQFQFVQLPYVERFEFVGVASQLMRVLPVLCLSLWSVSRITKIITNIRLTTTVPIYVVLLFIFVTLLSHPKITDYAHLLLSYSGMTIVYAYIPIMFLLVMIKKVKPG
ncbi:GerAB/ArcD/ProY family transporter [Paenibacillus sp. V4I7]|uniref:GerAB/ArcD/ProY family transporter n=1 Tax=Paenibacillus sp. V4I7 TaxID=3042307 RepID=UPI002783BBF6|nr:GerAB/ArcD/ProY family transporter [Paenibacillus sp. V4I7]MDQ0899368.1 spore germination protein (amino acid permease) [Paenibacillus sp. V4I7]